MCRNLLTYLDTVKDPLMGMVVETKHGAKRATVGLHSTGGQNWIQDYFVVYPHKYHCL